MLVQAAGRRSSTAAAASFDVVGRMLRSQVQAVLATVGAGAVPSTHLMAFGYTPSLQVNRCQKVTVLSFELYGQPAPLPRQNLEPLSFCAVFLLWP